MSKEESSRNTLQKEVDSARLRTKMTSSNAILHLQGNLDGQTVQLIEKAKFWAETELEPVVAYNWERATFPPNIFESFRNDCPELLGYTLPKEYGGCGYNLLTACHISRTLASVDASFTTALLVQYGLCAESIYLCGNEEQKHRLLPVLAKLEKIGCFCLTEPQSGSDASDLSTTARKVDGGYKISGLKRWIGNATTAEVFVVWAKNVSMKGNPVMGFIVQRSQQHSPTAVQTKKIEGKISLRIVQNADVEFCDAFCHDANVMDGHGKNIFFVFQKCLFPPCLLFEFYHGSTLFFKQVF